MKTTSGWTKTSAGGRGRGWITEYLLSLSGRRIDGGGSSTTPNAIYSSEFQLFQNQNVFPVMARGPRGTKFSCHFT